MGVNSVPVQVCDRLIINILSIGPILKLPDFLLHIFAALLKETICFNAHTF